MELRLTGLAVEGDHQNGLERAILSLEQLPKRFRIAPERFDPDEPIRVFNYGRSPHVYRVFFTIDETATVHPS